MAFWDNPVSNIMGGVKDMFNWGGDNRLAETSPNFFGPSSTLANNGAGINGSGSYGGMSGWGNTPANAGGGGFSMGGLGDFAQGLGGMFQGYAALKGLGLAEDQFDFSKDAFNANYLAQAKNYNQQLHGRQRAEYLSTGRAGQANNAYEHPDEKLAKWGVSERAVG